MFRFIYDAPARVYHLWWDDCAEHKLATLRLLCIGVWEIVPSWQANLRFDLPYQVIKARTKEDAVRQWLVEGVLQ